MLGRFKKGDHASVRVKRALLRWMLHPVTSERLEKMFFHFSDGDSQVAGHVSEALDWISIVRNSYVASPHGTPEWLNQPSDNVL